MEYYQSQLFAENILIKICKYKNCELELTNYGCKTIKDVLVLLIMKTRLNSVMCKSMIY